MERRRRWGWSAYWGVTSVVVALGLVMAALAPVDPEMGPIQKLIYMHLPVAVNTFLASLVVFIASVGYLGGRRPSWDHLAHAAAVVTVLNGTVLLITGMFWAKAAWGLWWVWSPRLTFSLILWLLYASYLVLRSRVNGEPKRAMVSAVYGVVAFLDVPLLYLSVKLMPDVHPTRSGLTPEMYPTLWVWFAGMALLTGGLMASRFGLGRLVSSVVVERTRGVRIGVGSGVGSEVGSGVGGGTGAPP